MECRRSHQAVFLQKHQQWGISSGAGQSGCSGGGGGRGASGSSSSSSRKT